MVSMCACCWQQRLYRYVLTCKMLCDACIWVHPNNKLSVCSIIMGPPTSHTNLPHQYSLHSVRTLSPPPLPSTPSPSVLPPPCKNPTVPFSLFTFNSHLPTHLTLMHSSPPPLHHLTLPPHSLTPPAPTGAPTNVTVDCQTHAVVVTWCVPEKEDRNGQITGFRVELHCPGQPTQWKQVTRTKQCVTTTFKELLAGKTYRVRVKAFNAAGDGPFSEFLPARTKEAGEQALLP